MSFERNKFGFDGEISFECDGCDEECHTDLDDFISALEYAKSEGWRAVKEGSSWCHYCDICSDH